MFASCHHLWDYLQTPLFENEPLDWDGQVGVIELRMHESTYGHPAGSEGGPDATCHQCGRAFWDRRPPADPEDPGADRGVPWCPTCHSRIIQANPDEPARRIEREAIGGDVHARARALNERVRRGEVPMANVSLAAVLAGRRDAALLDPPQFDFEYVNADRRDLVRWALALFQRIPTENEAALMRAGEVQQWLAGGGRPRAPARGSRTITHDAIRMIRARSNRALHGLVVSVIENYRIGVYQRFMGEMGGHHGNARLSPAWGLEWRGRPVVTTGENQFGTPTVGYDPLIMRNASARQATDLLGRILLHEE
jgi:hypothetical protein